MTLCAALASVSFKSVNAPRSIHQLFKRLAGLAGEPVSPFGSFGCCVAAFAGVPGPEWR